MTAASSLSDHNKPFRLIRQQAINSLSLVVEEYVHIKTGAQHLHLSADNNENVFLVALRTMPSNSSGVAHVLEHTALCGSKRYPVKDPFFMMTRRSLNTFMNAFTSSDWTAYPFASQNRKDFYNLLDVYMDAVFFSRLDELDFAQEGHHLEFENPQDSDSNLVYKGVVLNEMKGAMSSPTSVLWQTVSKYLFPTTTYHHNSGGDPEHIPDLTYKELQEFYQKHYHPSNAIFMTYGDITASEHQAVFENALQHFDRLLEEFSVPYEKRYYAPLNIEESYALDEENSANKTHIVLSWLLSPNTNLEEVLKVQFMSDVLLDNSSCPLLHALETTELGTSPSALSGLEDNNHEMSFICGVEGSNPEQADDVETLILNTLGKVAEEGIPQQQAEAVLHQLELHQREITGDGYPYGLQLILSALPSCIHRGDPIELLDMEPVLTNLRENIKDPEFIKNLIKDNLLNNQHRVRLCLKPDAGLSKRKIDAELSKLAQIKSQLDSSQKQAIIEHNKALIEHQQLQDDIDILPKVGLDDVPSILHIPCGNQTTVNQTSLNYFNQGTNGICYQQVIVDLPSLNDELIDILPYYTSCMTEVGVDDKDYQQTQLWQSQVCGSLFAYTTVRSNLHNEQEQKAHFVLSGKALSRNHQSLTELIQKTFENVNFNEPGRLRELISQYRTRREQSITQSGHGFVMSAAAAGFSPSANLSHRLSGLQSVQTIKQLDDAIQDDKVLNALIDKFNILHQRIKNSPRQFLLINNLQQCDTERQQIANCWQTLDSKYDDFSPFTLAPVREARRQCWVTSTQVNFCSKAFPTVATEHPDTPALYVLGGFLRNDYLHRVIREQGGAYGGGGGQDTGSASFRFYSYRDPRLLETLNDFDASIEWLLNEDHQWHQVEQAILGVISQIDKPSSPAGEAKQAFHNSLYGRTEEQRTRLRNQILKVTLDDLKRVGQAYFKPESASIAVITNSDNVSLLSDLGCEVINL